jgi:Putative multicopper oxidases
VLHVIGFDGNPVPHRQDKNWVLLAPGNRVEFLVQGGKPGVYPLRSLDFNEGSTTSASSRWRTSSSPASR